MSILLSCDQLENYFYVPLEEFEREGDCIRSPHCGKTLPGFLKAAMLKTISSYKTAKGLQSLEFMFDTWRLKLEW